MREKERACAFVCKEMSRVGVSCAIFPAGFMKHESLLDVMATSLKTGSILRHHALCTCTHKQQHTHARKHTHALSNTTGRRVRGL